MASARDHPEMIKNYLAEECEKGRVIGPLDPDQATHVRQMVWGDPKRSHTGQVEAHSGSVSTSWQ